MRRGRRNEEDEGAEDESICGRDERKVGSTEGEQEALQHEGGGR